jgi:hypothetical protein
LQLRQFGFEGDMPDDAESFRRYCECDGRWSPPAALTGEDIARGRELVEQLMRSGDVCGFKDPRTVQTWPFWQQVFETLPGLRIVPLVLLRGPHEIAMSIFRRSQGDRDYARALDVTAVHFRRMKEILDQWSGPAAVVRFDPQVYGAQARQAAELCGLDWSDAALAESYDASCRHFEATTIDHPAQAAFDALAGLPSSQPGADDLRKLLADATAREAMLRQNKELRQQERDAAREERDWARYERDVARHEKLTLQHQNTHLQQRADMVPPLETQLAQASLDLDLIRRSRIWRAREALVGAWRFTRRDHEGANEPTGTLRKEDSCG